MPRSLRTSFPLPSELDGQGLPTPTEVRDAWVNCLRDAFSAFYKRHASFRKIATFGGKPRRGEPKASGVPTGIRGWRRWEFLHDIAVVEWKMTEAAFARDPAFPSGKRPLPVVARAIWQVESELAGDGAKVAEDASKLNVCLAENKLLVACLTTQRAQQRWLDFLARTMAGTDGARFIALIPNYGRPR